VDQGALQLSLLDEKNLAEITLRRFRELTRVCFPKLTHLSGKSGLRLRIC
jgi:hypothetical protein